MSSENLSRVKAFKNSSKCDERKTRRHEVTVELRKCKKDDHLFKRRNINEDDLVSPLKENNGQSSPFQMSIDEIVMHMNSTDVEKQFSGTQAARKMLSRERNPPIDLLISHGIVPICVRFLQDFDHPLLQFEAAWALTNIASGTSEQTSSVIDSNAIPHFIKLLTSPNTTVTEQAVWALGNIAGDGAIARDIVFNQGVVDGILRLINNETQLSSLRNIVWLMSNLCRNKNPSPPFDQIKLMLPVLSQLLLNNDSQVLSDACWAISYVTDDEIPKIQAVVDTGVVPRLVKLLESNETSIIVPALRSVGNIVTGSDQQTDAVIAAGALPKLSKLLQSSKQNIVKEAAWTVSNITAGNQRQIQEVIDIDILNDISYVLEKGDFKSQKEAAWVVTNITTSGAPQQVIALIEKYPVLKPFCDLLDSKDARTIKVVLTGLTNLFCLAEKLCVTENFCLMIEQYGGLDKLESLQNHANEEVYQKAFSIIDTYFSDSNTNESELEPKENNGTLEFNPGTSENSQNTFNF